MVIPILFMTKSLVFNIHSEIECSICLKCKIFLNVCFWFFICVSAAVAVVNFMFFNNIGFLDCIILLILIFIAEVTTRGEGYKNTIVAVWSKKTCSRKTDRAPDFKLLLAPPI